MPGSFNNQTTAQGGGEDRILQTGAIDKLPPMELATTLEMFVEPVLMHLPEKQLREVARLAVQGIIGGQSPVVPQMARGVAREDEAIWLGLST